MSFTSTHELVSQGFTGVTCFNSRYDAWEIQRKPSNISTRIVSRTNLP